MHTNCNFSGYATRNGLTCADGKRIKKGAFAGCDGKQVPLLYQHNHEDVRSVIGHAILEDREDGVYAYCYLNDTETGNHAKKVVEHGDVRGLSIFANNIKQIGSDVVHGVIRELSMVLAGANPGAFIDYGFAHEEDGGDYIEAFYDENIMLYHSEPEKESKTIQDILDSMTDEQREVTMTLVGMAREDVDDIDDEEDDDEENEDGGAEMKHNAFESKGNDTLQHGVLTVADQKKILDMAKSASVGTLKHAIELYEEQNELQHDAIASGFVQTGEGNVSDLFPEYKDLKPGAPELLTTDQGWISVVMNKVHRSPISRIRTGQVDIRKIDDLRAQGYEKGKEKKIIGNFNLVRRTTDPQTVYVKNALHRDDVLDIQDFEYVQYMNSIMRIMMNEELATAFLFGDGREEGAEGKIQEDHIRPIWGDDPLYTRYVDLDIAAEKASLNGTDTGVSFGENYIRAEALIKTLLYAREEHKGTGTPDMFIHPHELNVMLLAKDMNGRRIYSSKAELAAALNVNNIYTVEQMADKVRTDTDGNEHKLLCLVVNLSDYHVGAVKGGQLTQFNDFDINFNQLISLLETRLSGTLTKVYSAIAIEEPIAKAAEPEQGEESAG